jgi:hypothetical protein
VLTGRSEDKPQIAANHLNRIAEVYNIKIPETKTKAVGIFGNNIQRVKIELGKQ